MIETLKLKLKVHKFHVWICAKDLKIHQSLQCILGNACKFDKLLQNGSLKSQEWNKVILSNFEHIFKIWDFLLASFMWVDL